MGRLTKKEKSKRLKDYMNSAETSDMAIMGKLLDVLDIFINAWSERDNLSVEEHKGFKMALTWGSKAWDSIMARMNDKTLIGYVKRQNSYSVYVYDNVAFKQARKKVIDAQKELYKKEEHFYNLCGLVMDRHCRDCICKDSECDIAKLFIENNVQEPIMEPNYDWKHCKYAYFYDDVVKRSREFKEEV